MIFKRFLALILLILLAGIQLLRADIDLEQTKQGFVLETKQIEIPGYPHAFNPSIVRWRGTLLLSFRIIPFPKITTFNSRIGLIWLDDAFNPISEPQLLDLSEPYPSLPSRAEDGRLLLVGDRLWMVYSDNRDSFISKGGFRVYMCEILFDGEKFSADHIECLSKFEGANENRREKNWTPFVCDGSILLSYSLLPHLIFKPLLDGSCCCDTICFTTSDINWEWGELRGGTTALQMGDQYLAFFHSQQEMVSIHSKNKVATHYFMGAYTYSLIEPFEITQFSPEPIIGEGFYHGNTYKHYWKPVNVVFPCGYVFDDNFIWIAYGRQDHEVWIAKLSKPGLLDSLIPINTPQK